jgi:hypothetical protein
MATITIETLKADFEAGIITAVKCDGYTRFTCSISGARWAVVKLAKGQYKIVYEVLCGEAWSYTELAKALAKEPKQGIKAINALIKKQTGFNGALDLVKSARHAYRPSLNAIGRKKDNKELAIIADFYDAMMKRLGIDKVAFRY